MVNFKSTPFIFLSVLLLFCLSCEDSSLTDSITNNTPASAIRTNSFSYAIDAKRYNITENYNVDFNSQTIEVAFAIAMFSGGKVRIEIQSQNDSKIYEREFNGNAAYTEKLTLEQLPKKIQLKFDNLSASLSCSVAVKEN